MSQRNFFHFLPHTNFRKPISCPVRLDVITHNSMTLKVKDFEDMSFQRASLHLFQIASFNTWRDGKKHPHGAINYNVISKLFNMYINRKLNIKKNIISRDVVGCNNVQ